jgi:hypothetical protein
MEAVTAQRTVQIALATVILSAMVTATLHTRTALIPSAIATIPVSAEMEFKRIASNVTTATRILATAAAAAVLPKIS